jgi:hypothetical protein
MLWFRNAALSTPRPALLGRASSAAGTFVLVLTEQPYFQINVSALSEARFRESVKLGEVLFARSIEPFEGGRWRLRWTRANGYGNSIFSLICKLLVLQYLENERVREPQFDALRWGMTCGA